MTTSRAPPALSSSLRPTHAFGVFQKELQELAKILDGLESWCDDEGEKEANILPASPAEGPHHHLAAAAAVAGDAFALAAPGVSVATRARPVPEPTRLKGLMGVLRRLGLPVLELAFFPKEERSRLVVRDPNEAARDGLHIIHAFKDASAPPYPISKSCEAVRVRETGPAAAAALAALILSGEDHGRDARGRKLRLRWGALDAADMNALVQV